MRLTTAVASLSLLCGAALAGEELVREQFPGCSVSLPKGDIKSSTKNPFAGRHEVRLARPSLLDHLNPLSHRVPAPRVVLSWSQHGLDAGEYYDHLRGTLLKSLPGKPAVLEELKAHDAWVSVIGDASAPVGFGTRQCERGFNIDVVVGVSTDVDEQFALTRQIVDSMKCTLTEANRRALEAATRLPNGFLRIKRETTPTYASLSGETIVINFTTGNVLRDPKIFSDVMVGSVSQASGLPVSKIRSTTLPLESTPGRKAGLLHLGLPDGEVAYIGALWCPKLGVTFMSVYTGQSPVETRARVLFASVDCPGEPSQSPDDAKPVFEAACKAGNAYACGMLAEFAF